MDVINPDELASYLSGYDIPNGRITQAVTITNNLITELVGELAVVPTRFKAIALEVAARPLRNPGNVLSRTEAVDDWQETERFAEHDAPLGGWYLSDDEIDRLLGRSTVKRARTVGTIRTAVPGYPLGG